MIVKTANIILVWDDKIVTNTCIDRPDSTIGLMVSLVLVFALANCYVDGIFSANAVGDLAEVIVIYILRLGVAINCFSTKRIVMKCCDKSTVKLLIYGETNFQNLVFHASSCSCLCAIYCVKVWGRDGSAPLGCARPWVTANSLWLCDAIRRHKPESIWVPLMACSLTAPSQHLNEH